jgi:alkylation response protein AidB-like acyl-CoA dehydrogenase
VAGDHEPDEPQAGLGRRRAAHQGRAARRRQLADHRLQDLHHLWRADLADNIIHLVLARTPDAPVGTRGISLFPRAKVLPDGTRNDLRCASIEHKLGIHASPTCTMAYGDNGGRSAG